VVLCEHLSTRGDAEVHRRRARCHDVAGRGALARCARRARRRRDRVDVLEIDRSFVTALAAEPALA
jgi:hypothetical protein